MAIEGDIPLGRKSRGTFASGVATGGVAIRGRSSATRWAQVSPVRGIQHTFLCVKGLLYNAAYLTVYFFFEKETMKDIVASERRKKYNSANRGMYPMEQQNMKFAQSLFRRTFRGLKVRDDSL